MGVGVWAVLSVGGPKPSGRFTQATADTQSVRLYRNQTASAMDIQLTYNGPSCSFYDQTCASREFLITAVRQGQIEEVAFGLQSPTLFGIVSISFSHANDDYIDVNLTRVAGVNQLTTALPEGVNVRVYDMQLVNTGGQNCNQDRVCESYSIQATYRGQTEFFNLGFDPLSRSQILFNTYRVDLVGINGDRSPNVTVYRTQYATPYVTPYATPYVTPYATPYPTPPADTIVPTVSITAPANGARMPKNGNMTISARSSDNSGFVSSIVIKFDGVIKKTCSSVLTCSVNMNVNGVANGNHTITATATDLSSNIATASITVIK